LVGKVNARSPQIARNDLEKCGGIRLFTDRNPLNTKQISEMNNHHIDSGSPGSNSPQNPQQNTPKVPDGSLTKGDVSGQNPATQTKQQTAQMPMKSTIAAQTAQQSIDGGAIRST
jgi:hypothetical protein